MSKKFLEMVKTPPAQRTFAISMDELVCRLVEASCNIQRPLNTSARAAVAQLAPEELQRFRAAGEAAVKYILEVSGASAVRVDVH